MAVPTLSSVDRPRAFGYDLALGDRLFRLAVGPGRELTIKTAPIEAPRINTTSSPEEAAEDFGLVYARSAFDGGSGLFRAHAEGAAPNRFWDSQGVDVQHLNTGEFPDVTLLHDTELVTASAEDNLHMAVANGHLWVVAGTTVLRSENPNTAEPVFITETPTGTPAEGYDIAALGGVVYVAMGESGIYRYSALHGWSQWSTVEATRVWTPKGRVVASDGASLYEITDTDTAPQPLVVLNTGIVWNDACDGGSHVLAASSDGIVYAFTTQDGGLVLQSQTTFEGESVTSLGQTQGVVSVGTSAGQVGRWYVGTLAGDGQIAEQQLVKEWSDAHAIATLGTRASIYVGITTGGQTNLWRYDVVTGGVIRHLGYPVAGTINGIASIGDRLFATVDGSGVWAESEDFVAEGWLIGPLGDFYDADAKSWVGAMLDTGPLAAGKRVTLSYTTVPEALNDADSATWVQTIDRNGGSGVSESRLAGGVVSRYIAGKVTLHASTARDDTPTVRSFSFRGFTSSGEEDRIVQAPVNVSDQIERRGRRRVRVKGRGEREWQSLRALEGQTMVLRLFKPSLALDGLLQEVATPIQMMSRRGSPMMVSLITFRGRLTATSDAENTTDGWLGAFGTDTTFGELPAFAEEIAS